MPGAPAARAAGRPAPPRARAARTAASAATAARRAASARAADGAPYRSAPTTFRRAAAAPSHGAWSSVRSQPIRPPSPLEDDRALTLITTGSGSVIGTAFNCPMSSNSARSCCFVEPLETTSDRRSRADRRPTPSRLVRPSSRRRLRDALSERPHCCTGGAGIATAPCRSGDPARRATGGIDCSCASA